MQFKMRAVSAAGILESLAVQAVDETSARLHAERLGFTVVSVRRTHDWFSPRGSSQRFPILLFSQELLVLLNAGLPLVEGIDTLAQKERREDFRVLLARVVELVRQGHPLSWALEQFPKSFPALYVATVRAAEKTSDLAPALQRYIAYQEQVNAVRTRVINASIYPALLIAIGTLVTLFLLFHVVPRFGRVYADRGADLPVVSQLLLAWGRSVEGYGLAAVVALLALAALGVHLARFDAVRARLGDIVWRIPAIGERLHVYQLARFYRTTGMLIGGGVPLVGALAMAGELLHPRLRAKLAHAQREISEGRAVSDSLAGNGLATPVASRLLAVGEQGGNMGDVMERIGIFHDEETARWVDWFTRLFEPLLMALIGVVIGAIVILMYIPIFELAGGLQ